MKVLKNWKIKENIIKVLKIYPVVLICFLAIGTLAILLVHIDNIDEEIVIKINFCIAIFAGFALILKSLKIQFEKFSYKQYLIALFICLTLSIGYYFTLNTDNEWTIRRTLIIWFIEGLLFISLTFIKNDDKAEHFANLAAGRLIISGILFGIAYGGVAGILFALEELFNLDISYKLYGDFAIGLATTFLPMLWLAGLNYQVKPSKKKLYKVLLSFVCIPLLFVYSAVVYGFIIKIALDGFKIPSSISIAHLVLWYSFVSIIVTYLARPYEDNSLTKFFYKWYPLISILPIAVMFIAIFLRINQYGITISRYYLLLGGIWLALMFGYLIFVRFAKKKRLNIVITLSIALFALISIAEPISANTIAEKSQIKRLKEVVISYIDGDTIDIESMSNEEIKKAQDILHYLDWNHYGYSVNSDNNYFNNIDFLTKSEAKNILDANTTFVDVDRDGRRYLYINSEEKIGGQPVVNIEGYKYLFIVKSYSYYDDNFREYDSYKIEIINQSDNDNEVVASYINIYIDDELMEQLSLVECYGDKILEKKESFGEDNSDFIYENDNQTIKIILTNINFWYSDEVAITAFEGYILIK